MYFNRIVYLFTLILFSTEAIAQYGCTDYQAVNFDSTAMINDGSCVYPVTFMPLATRCHIDSFQLAETSGIMNHNNNYWTHVDNTDNAIYRIDTNSNSVLQHVVIQNAFNQDWEDISSDNNFIYVGDIGNNGGNRTNLRFYKINKSNILPNTTSVFAGSIRYSYSDQVVFNNSNGSYYDCEAFIVLNDSIHMFTKGWTTRWTRHYVLPTDTGVQVAQLVDSFNVDGLVTSAAIQGDSVMVLLGLNYTGALKSFVWVFSQFNGSDFFGGNKRRLEIGDLNTTGQSEAICFSGMKKGFITNEKLPATPSLIREFDLNPFLPVVPNAAAVTTVNNNIFNLNACGDSGIISVKMKNMALPGGSDLTYTIGLLPIFATAPPLYDTLSLGDSSIVTININTGMLSAGTYYGDVVFVTNDPFNILLPIPVVLNVDSNPCADFIFTQDTCTGVMEFTSTSINSPTSYHWDFGDGNISTDTNPAHTYSADGNYTVTLESCNGLGCDTVDYQVTAVTRGPIATTCYPQTQSYCCGSGIYHVRIIGPANDVINNLSSDASAGFEDFSCTTPGTMVVNSPYTLACTTGDTNIESLRVWIDLNNDGYLDPAAEEIYSDTTAQSYIHIGSIVIPANPGNVYGFPLRMRVASDFQSAPLPCQNPVYGQQEDYPVILNFTNNTGELPDENNFSITPNPSTGKTSLNYSLKTSSRVSIETYNIIGEKVETLLNEEMHSPGNHVFEIFGYKSGIYFVRLTINNESIVERIIIL